MNGRPQRTLPDLLHDQNPDTHLIIDCFIRGFNAAYGNPAADHWDISKEEWQRYEFLGDRVLDLIVAQTLFTRRDSVLDEGEMTKILSSVVSNQSLDSLTRRTDPAGFARLVPASIGEQNSYGERVTGGAFEAFIGALYCETGLDDVACFINAIMAEARDRYDPQGNAVGILQECFQKKGMPPPEYEVVARAGPDHRPIFTVRVTAPDGRFAEGTGKSIPDARQAAAIFLLK